MGTAGIPLFIQLEMQFFMSTGIFPHISRGLYQVLQTLQGGVGYIRVRAISHIYLYIFILQKTFIVSGLFNFYI